MRLTHAREVEVFVELDAEKKTRCLRLEKGDLKSDQNLASSDRRCHYVDIIKEFVYISNRNRSSSPHGDPRGRIHDLFLC